MKTVINYASGKPSDPLRGYSYVHDSNLRQPRQIAALVPESNAGSVAAVSLRPEQLSRSERSPTFAAQLHPPAHDLFWANLRVQFHLPPLDLAWNPVVSLRFRLAAVA